MNDKRAYFARALPIAGTCLMAIALAWLFSTQGFLGVALWYSPQLVLGLALIGILPVVLMGAGLLMKERLPRPAKALAIASIIAGIVSIAVATIPTGIIAGISLTPVRAGFSPTLLDPSALPSPRDSAGIRIAISSDPHFGKEKSSGDERRRIERSVAAGPYDALFVLGDVTELGMYASQWVEALSEFKANMGTVPLRPLLGNHDALVHGEPHYLEAFFPFRTPDSGSKLYWAADWGGTHIVVVNALWDETSVDGAQLAWIERTLAACDDGAPIVVMMHAYAYASGYTEPDTGSKWFDVQGMIDRLCPLFEKHGVDLVVSGHNHFMEYLERNGVHYAIIGAMGGVPDPDPEYVSPASLWFRRGMYGFIDLARTDRGLDLAFRAANGDILYETSIPPDAAPGTPAPESTP